MMPGFFAAFFIVAVRLAAVPPEKVPCIARTRPLTRGAGLPWRVIASSCSISTPRSKGIESNPLEKQMRAPLALALSWCRSICSRIHAGSPHRSA